MLLSALYFSSILHLDVSLFVVKDLDVPSGYEVKKQLIFACNKIIYYKSL